MSEIEMRAIEAVKATQWVTFKAVDGGTSTAAGTPEEIAGAVLTAVAPILLAAGRTAAAADIRQKINDWRPQANTSLYALDVLSLAAEIAEGKTDA